MEEKCVHFEMVVLQV